VRTAFGALRRNKMRSLLTTLGIVIGVAAVIAMVEIGQGSAKAIQAQIASMGASTLMIQPGAAASGGVSFGLGSAMTLTPEDAEEIARQCPSVADVAPVVRSRTQIVYGSRNWVPMFLLGTTPDYLKIREWTDLAEGIMFSDSDVSSGSQVCVIGDTLKRELFEDQSPVGKSVRINNVSFRVIGVLSHKGANMGGMDQDDIVVAPWPAIKYRVSGNSVQNVNQSAAAAAADSMNKVNSLNLKYPGSPIVYPQPSALQAADTPQLVRFSNVDMIMASVPSPQEIPQAIDQITQLLRDRHRIRNGELDDFHIRDMSEITKIFTSTSGLMSILLLVVAMISLVVGGVGIMNIMLVSVTERTREIGLRMAVGARSYHILRQFLVEAVVLCLVGGAIGIMLGRFASLMVKTYLHWPTSISLPIIIAAVAVSASVGVIFGFYPAWKASRLDPIEALRYE
jgi:ABC-type antimicrobial peptide transport system permease subunit